MPIAIFFPFSLLDCDSIISWEVFDNLKIRIIFRCIPIIYTKKLSLFVKKIFNYKADVQII